jgi:hypothetical protein
LSKPSNIICGGSIYGGCPEKEQKQNKPFTSGGV